MPETNYEIRDGKMKPAANKDEKENQDVHKPSAAGKSGYETKQEGY
ncbi:MAG: hypothetical protein HDR37_08095 [Treponema sp.]|nr:hypothetical protein [Treponema sp.]